MTATHTLKPDENKDPKASDTTAKKPEAEAPQQGTPQTGTKPRRRARNPKRDGGGKSMADLADGYIKHLDEEGKAHGTLFSYGMEMKLACSVLGEKTKLTALTPKKVLGFYEHERVITLRSGKPKSQLSIDKSRRVLRLALVWAVEQKWIEEAPLPDVNKAGK